MLKQVGSSSGAAIANNSEMTGLSPKSGTSKVVHVAKLLGNQLKEAMTRFSGSSSPRGNAQAPTLDKALQRSVESLRKTIQHLQVEDQHTMVFRKVDSELPVTKQLAAQKAMTFVDGLKSICSKSIWSDKGNVNLSFIEHFCGLIKTTDKAVPEFKPLPMEGNTALLAPQRDFTLGVITNEIQLIDSMLHDIRQNGIAHRISHEACHAMAKVSDQLKASANLLSTISRNTLLHVQGKNPNAVSNAARMCFDSVKKLPPGEKLLIPLAFISKGSDGVTSSGHATYLVVEKNLNNSVNLHMVNRGAGSSVHGRQPGDFPAYGQQPKIESAVSKWNVPMGVTGGFSHNFLLKTFMLTLDAKVATNGKGIVETFHSNPSMKMRENIAQFYRELGARKSSGPPSGFQPIYQRAQKDGNCAYSNLKASIRYLLNDSKIYNQIDLLKTEKVARLTLKYMKENLLVNPQFEAKSIDRMVFNAQRVADKLIIKHEKAEHRINLDNFAAMPLDLPEHLQNVTN